MPDFISISSGAYNGYPLPVAFDEVARIGGTHLELIFIHGFSNPFAESYFCAANAAEVNRLYAASGLRCGAFAAHMDLSTPEALTQFVARMDFAKAIGSDFMITYAAPIDRARDFFSNMETFVRHAEDIGIVIAFENPGDGKRNLIEAGRSGAEIMRHFASPHVKFNYDFGNLMSQFRHDMLPEEDLARVIDHTVHLHVKDSLRTESGWEYPAIGDGDIDFARIFADLHARNIDLPVCLEVPVTMTRDLYGAAMIAGTPPPLVETNATLRRSLDAATRLTACFESSAR
jgi:sugar phosphate isomerase/epimerase